jgi:hypothetical protein
MNPVTLDDARALLEAAATPGDLFPGGGATAARRYHRLARLLHPDAVPDHRKDEAQAAFRALTTLWERRKAPTLTTSTRTYTLGPVHVGGDLAVLREAGDGILLKIPRQSRDNDLMEREARALTRLDRRGDPRHRAYAPRLLEAFRHRESGAGAGRRVNALERLRGFRTLTEVRSAHPEGLDPRDAAWMWRRLLVALGWAHRAGVVHGAVLPDHVLVHPHHHGLALVDWCYSVEAGGEQTIPALVERYRDWYPHEVTGRRPATAATDIHLASKCLEHLMGPLAPRPLRSFLRGCTLPAQARRPQDAWKLLAELDDLLERLYGPRTFRPFTTR